MLPPRRAALAASILLSVAGSLGAADLARGHAIVISEISYNPPASLGDDAQYEFVELHNRGDARVDLSGWQLKDRDELHGFVLPPGTAVAPGAQLVLARDAAALRRTYGADIPVVGDVGFPLGNDGESVRIHDARGELVDQVTILDRRPWPVAADGEGATLERIAVLDDTTDFSNFAASVPSVPPGTPGRPSSRAGQIPARHAVAITELMYNPIRDPSFAVRRHCAAEEFLELHNRGAAPVDLSGWSFERGIDFTFPPGSTLAPGAYLAVFADRGAFEAKYGPLPNAVGPFAGQLDDGGEEVLLVDATGEPVDDVEYDDRSPWPVNPDGLQGSLELVDPSSDNARGGAWRESAEWRGTPGAPNAATLAFAAAGNNEGPAVSELRAGAASGEFRTEMLSTDEVEVTARVLDRDGVGAVLLEYQVLPAGEYIPKDDPQFAAAWTVARMELDAGRALYAAVLSPAAHRTLVRYRVRAADASAARLETHWPRPEDPEPNLAYFVYDGVPAYVASERSAFGLPGLRHTGLDRVPVYHVIAREADIEEAQYTRLPDRPVYKWQVTLVHDGHVHDHVGLALRSGHRYSWPKRPWKIRFNRGNLFDGVGNDGGAYPRRRKKIHLMSNQHDAGKPRGECGVFESLAWRLFREADVVGAATTFVHLRFVRSPEEADQFRGDFFGAFLETQAIDTTLLEDLGRPTDDASPLYKLAGGPVKEHPDCTPVMDDVRAFMDGATRQASREYFEATLDVERYLSFRSVVELSDDHDMDSLKNFYYYFSSRAQRWEVIPWDLDNTFGADASGDEPLAPRVLPRFSIEYRNRLRFLTQVLYDERRLFGIIDGWTDLIGDLADADLDRWDTEPREACPDWPRTTGPQCRQYLPFLTRMRALKAWIRQRTRFVEPLLRDLAIPSTPTGASPRDGWPAATPVTLASSAFADPDAGAAQAAARWLLIPLGGDWAHPLWQETSTEHLLAATVPDGVLEQGAGYLYRVAHQDETGRWSRLSEPLGFIAGPASTAAPPPPRDVELAHVAARAVALRWGSPTGAAPPVHGYLVLRDGVALTAAPLRATRFGDFAPVPGATHAYEVVAVNTAGVRSPPSAAVPVEVPRLETLGGWHLPAAGLAYLYDARPGEDRYSSERSTAASLDGSWARSRADDWDGSGLGPGAGLRGGLEVAALEDGGDDGGPASVLALEDPGSLTARELPPQNQRLLFLRDAGGLDAAGAGATLVARWRINPRPRDLTAPGGQSPDDADGRGQIGLAWSDGSGPHLLSLWFDGGKLHAPDGASLDLDATTFHSIWATVRPEGARYRVRLFLDGASSPALDALAEVPGPSPETGFAGSHLVVGLSNREAAGAIEVDYVGLAAGAADPLPSDGPAERPFRRGDASPDGKIDLADALAVLRHLFSGDLGLACEDAADADDSGALLITDAIVLLWHAFIAGPPPRPPADACGPDPGADALSCERFEACP